MSKIWNIEPLGRPQRYSSTLGLPPGVLRVNPSVDKDFAHIRTIFVFLDIIAESCVRSGKFDLLADP